MSVLSIALVEAFTLQVAGAWNWTKEKLLLAVGLVEMPTCVSDSDDKPVILRAPSPGEE